MNRLLPSLPALVLGLALPLVVQAQTTSQGRPPVPPLTDREYCDALAATYNRFLGMTSSRASMPDVNASEAIAACQKGNTAAGIPVLETKLRNAQLPLPSRQPQN